MSTNDMVETLKEYLGTEMLLNELINALGDHQLRENLEYIANMWDIEL